MTPTFTLPDLPKPREDFAKKHDAQPEAWLAEHVGDGLGAEHYDELKERLGDEKIKVYHAAKDVLVHESEAAKKLAEFERVDPADGPVRGLVVNAAAPGHEVEA